MVQLTMTAAMVAALKYLKRQGDEPYLQDRGDGEKLLSVAPPSDLNTLLRGSQIYVEPPPPKPEPTEEFKALMARLRAEQESRDYATMLSPQADAVPLPSGQRHPNSAYIRLFPDSIASLSSGSTAFYASGSSRADPAADIMHDETTFADINRQLALIGNVLISVVACSVAIWWGTWHWSTAARLGASMGGSGLVGVAEVVVYWGWITRLGAAREREHKKKEHKKIAKTWVIEGRKGVVERRVVGVNAIGPEKEEGNAASGNNWIDVPESLRHRKVDSA